MTSPPILQTHTGKYATLRFTLLPKGNGYMLCIVYLEKEGVMRDPLGRIRPLGIRLPENEVVEIARTVYVKSPKALEALLKGLRKAGYTIQDIRAEKAGEYDEQTNARTVQSGSYLWYASLDMSRGKCLSCNSHISTHGIMVDGHRCEVCNAVTYMSIVMDRSVTFVFSESQGYDDRITMRAHHLDTETGELFLFPEPLRGNDLFGNSVERALAILKRHNHLWEQVDWNGQPLIKIQYSRTDESVIKVLDTFGGYSNHRIVRVYKGKEYGEFEPLPVLDSFSIYETWHWAPLERTPDLGFRVLSAAGQISDKGWYHQDGRPFFTQPVFENMAMFIEHFTSLSGTAFLVASKRFRRDGPGGVDDVMDWCYAGAQGDNNPNFGNTLSVISDALAGKTPTPRQLKEGLRGLEDPLPSKFFQKKPR